MNAPTEPLSVVLAGGGTAGHIEPAMAVADALRALDADVRITALGTQRGLETTLVPARGYRLELIPPVPLPRKPTLDLLRLPARVVRSVRRTRAVLDATDADVLVGFGGYVALPAYLAARGGLGRRRAVPIVVHEANASAGIANKVGARLARRVLAAVPGSGVKARGSDEAEIVGIPVRPTITGLDRAATREQAREHFGLPSHGPVLLVFGGSQGARSLNEAVAGAATELAEAGVSVLHAHGPKNTVDVAVNESAVVDGRPAARYVAVPYLTRMDLAYAAADLAICRSGCDDGRRGLGDRSARDLCSSSTRKRRAGTQRPADRRVRRRHTSRGQRVDLTLCGGEDRRVDHRLGGADTDVRWSIECRSS